MDTQLILWFQATHDANRSNVASAYDAATPAVQAQVKAALGVP